MDDGSSLHSRSGYRCGAAVIDLGRRQVLVDGVPARLGTRAFDMLVALVERHERVVTKRELLDLVWPKLVVEDNNLQVQIVGLRKLLGPQAIATIPGRGYRFTMPVEDVAGAVSPAGAAPLSPTNLPARATLFGRDDDLRLVAELMRVHPLVSLVGAGGIGKTQLALAAAAAEAPEDYPDGRWWVELATINEAARIPQTIAAALAVPLAVGNPPLEALAAALASQRLLLVLDNCEHLADDIAPLIATLRARAPQVRILVTSQESLKCPGEQIYRLGSLAIPTSLDVEEAAQYGAVALFVDRAHAADPRFRLAAENVAAVVDICRRLDGIPLAIELAAARVPLLGVAGLQARLDQMFNVLTGAARMKLRRHQTLCAALEWSYGLLSEDERAVFRRLGVFAGGFSLELAQQVVGDARIDEWQVLDLLGHLVDKSLVIAEGEAEPRYRLLEPTRAYALEQLAAAGESGPWLRRHAEAVLALLDARYALRWTCSNEDLRRSLLELGNLRAAVDWALKEGEQRLACRLFGRGWNVWKSNNVANEGLDRMRLLGPLPAGIPAADEADFCVAYAQVRGGRGRDEFLGAAHRAVALARELGDRERLAEALMTLVEVAASRDEPTDIGDALREIEALSSERDPLRKQVQLARTQGVWALRNHDYAASIAAFRRQGELCRSSGNESGEHFAACNAANVYLDAADFDAAIEAARRAHEGLQRLRSPYGQNVALYYLVQGLAMRGDDDGLLTLAREVFNRTRSFEATGAPAMSAALCHARRGDAARAGLLAGYARSMVARTKAYPCPIDLHMRARLRECLDARYDDAQVEVWQQAGERLTDAQALAVGFDDAPVVNFLS